MTEARFFFEDTDEASIDRVRPSLETLGATIEPFFDNTVNYVITKKTVGSDMSTSKLLLKAQQRSIKIWTYEKLNRFLTNLLGHSPIAQTSNRYTGYDLSHMLQNEKVLGPYDRDMNARRDDYHYFEGPYLLVWDLKHTYRPLMVKEYASVSDPNKGDWPRLRTSFCGRSPFVEDPLGLADRLLYMEEMGKKKAERERKRKATLLDESSSKKLIVATDGGSIRQTSVIVEEEISNKNSDSSNDMVKTPYYKQKLTENSGNSATPNSGRFQEIIASGVNMSNATSAVRSVALQSNEPGYGGNMGNGLNQIRAQVPSREVINLKKKVLDREAIGRITRPSPSNSKSASSVHLKSKPAPQSASTAQSRKKPTPKEDRSGYCENCQEQFESFEDHIVSKKHRKYATNSSNFTALDNLLSQLERPLKSIHI